VNLRGIFIVGNFKDPEFLLLFVPLVLFAIFQVKLGRKNVAQFISPASDSILKKAKTKLPSPWFVHFILRIFALSLLIIAVARPQETTKKEKRIVEAIDICIAFDVSKSMDAIDFKPNRRSVAIEKVNSFVAKRIDDRFSVVIFSGDAYLAIPSTNDYKLVQGIIEKSNNSGITDGTAIGQALSVSALHLKSSKARSKVIILVTDGDNNMGSVDPRTAAVLAQGLGIKIYAIGLGKKGRVAYPNFSRDMFGREVKVMNYLTDAYNEELLKELSLKTGGRFFTAQDEGILESVFDEINKLEKTEVEVKSFTRVKELAWAFIALALFFLILEQILTHTFWRKFP